MCLNPIKLKKITGTDLHVIPCGKCVECLAHKANELTVRVIREVEYLHKFYFLTLTYRDDTMPFKIYKTTYDDTTYTYEERTICSGQSDRATYGRYNEEFFRQAPRETVFNKSGKLSFRYLP